MNHLSPSRSILLRRILAGIAAFIVLVVLVLVFFPWDVLRGPINRYVSDKLGRRFEITQRLSVHLGRTATVRADGLEFANPEWAREPYLVKAAAAEFDIRLWPLLMGRVEIPRLALYEPRLGLQVLPDGRRTWALSRDTANPSAAPDIGTLTLDRGNASYVASAQGADINVQFSISAEPSAGAAGSGAALPLSYKAAGKWRNEAFTASGRTGGVLQLSKDMKERFPIEVTAATGRTTLKATGAIENLQEMTGLDANVDLQGDNLEALYRIAGIVLPSTPPYKLRGRLTKQGKVWTASRMQGVLGSSDISGELSFDTVAAVPLLSGKVQSKVLDFADLRPVVGLPVKAATGGVKVAQKVVPAGAATAAAGATAAIAPKANTGRKVLPTAPLDLARLKAMNADVTYSAADIRHVEALPLDRGAVHVKLSQGVLQLDPVALGIAGGMLEGTVRIDANMVPPSFDTRLAVKALQLNQLFPTVESTKSSFGKITGQINLKGRGNNAAQMLGTANGDVAVLMGKGQISNILLEFMGLDGGEVIKFFLRGDRNVQLLCAAAAFNVKQGVMQSRTIVLDTSDTVINGSGQVSLADETLDITLNPQPKDRSILSLRSPLKIAGTFASPSAGPDKVALGMRAGATLALGLINPLLALAATIETGPGHDADCGATLALAADPKSTRVPASSPTTAAVPAKAQAATPAGKPVADVPQGPPGMR
ncbi:MAG: AsmA family protein [Polaromonas sp.]|nr:AsmA family protein [Polaromonas sp.]